MESPPTSIRRTRRHPTGQCFCSQTAATPWPEQRQNGSKEQRRPPARFTDSQRVLQKRVQELPKRVKRPDFSSAECFSLLRHRPSLDCGVRSL